MSKGYIQRLRHVGSLSSAFGLHAHSRSKFGPRGNVTQHGATNFQVDMDARLNMLKGQINVLPSRTLPLNREIRRLGSEMYVDSSWWQPASSEGTAGRGAEAHPGWWAAAQLEHNGQATLIVCGTEISCRELIIQTTGLNLARVGQCLSWRVYFKGFVWARKAHTYGTPRHQIKARQKQLPEFCQLVRQACWVKGSVISLFFF